MKPRYPVALIGYQFMGRAHSHAYREVANFFPESPRPSLKVICGRNRKAVENAARQYGWEEFSTDWRKVVEREDILVVDISTPGNLHHPIAVAAAKAGKHIICEKPLANNLKQALEMLEAVETHKVHHMVAFNYRRVPAIILAKQMIDQGRIGRVFHWRGIYYQDWIVDPNFPLVWRLQQAKAGSGAHGDLNAHLIDLAHYLIGDIEEVTGVKETFIKERPLPENPRMKGKVTVDDATLFLARFENGALGSFEATRMAPGSKNLLQIEINGSEGSLAFNLERLNELQYYNSKDSSGHQGYRTILVTEPVHPYIRAWWPPGHIIGWQHAMVHEVRDFLIAIEKKQAVAPDFYDGVRCQAVLEAVMQSARKGKWVRPGSLWKTKRRAT